MAKQHVDRMSAAELLKLHLEGKNPPKMRRRRRDLEGPVHRDILDLLEEILPSSAEIHHSPNEVDMSGPQAAKMVAKATSLGMRKGWPDLEIILFGPVIIFFEVKADKNSPPSTSQIECHDRLRALGAYVAIVWSRECVLKCFDEWKIPGINLKPIA